MSYNSKYTGAEVDAALDLANSALQEHQDISGKQDTLVSGTNIKTINGKSILGNGDITIETDSSSGSAAYPLVEHGTSDTTFTLTPNTFHVWDEVASLDLSFGDETSGVANEFLFQFTSGATATTLTLPDDIKWVSTPDIKENMIYQCSIVNDIGIFVEVSTLISFTILEVSYVASDGMTWEQWCNSDYNTDGYTISGGKVFIGGVSYVSLEDEFVSSTDTIKANYAYTTTSNEPV